MLSNALAGLGRYAARHPWRVIAAWVATVALAVLAAATVGGPTADTLSAPGLDSTRAQQLLQRTGDGEQGLTAQVVATPVGAATFRDDPGARAALTRLRAELGGLEHVLATTDPLAALGAGDGTAARSGLVSADGRVAVLRVQYPEQNQLSGQDLHDLLAVGEKVRGQGQLRVEMGGDLFVAFADADTGPAELVGVLAAATILFLAFGSLVAALLPIGMALFGLTIGVATMTALAGVTEVPTFAPILGSMVGLGVGIDYALFVLARHREYLRLGREPRVAAGLAVAHAGRPVVFAGLTVLLSVLGMTVAGIPFLTAGGVAVSLVVAIMVIASVTLLPAFLGLAGGRLGRTGRLAGRLTGWLTGRLPGRLARRGAGRTRGWARWIGHVNRHPGWYAAGAAGLLLTATVPVFGMRVGLPDGGSMSVERTERRAYDLVTAGFGPGYNGPLIVAVDLAGDTAVADRLATSLATDPGVAAVAPPRIDAATGTASLVVFPTTGPQDRATAETVDRLRAEVLPAAVGAGPARAHVGGAAASLSDVGRRTSERLPGFVAAVLALSFLLLLVVFRSVLVPVKAVVSNLLAIGAAYGLMVAVFQWGWGASLIGLETTVPIVSFIPMFLFAILFGLSMDYEVFLLSRVREEYLRSGDSGTAVVRGISGTARVITSAALIMVAVFLSFAVADDPSTKMLGFGLASAILIDVTIVRMVLVPATMTLLGQANWWLPRWLERLLPRTALESGATGETAGGPAVATGGATAELGAVTPR